MSDKAKRLHDADEAFTELHAAIDGLSDEQMRRVWFGTWGVREILIHTSSWQRAMIPALQHIGRGEPPYPDGMYDDTDAWNAKFVEQKAGVKTADVLVELDAAHRDFVRAAAGVPDQHFASDGAALGPFEGAGAPHYREHAAQIREWRKAAKQ
jgi:Mycothiol maleylpyruvate isomerase N-terminal domain